MKRWLSILAVFGCIVALSGCKNENEKRQAYGKEPEVSLKINFRFFLVYAE